MKTLIATLLLSLACAANAQGCFGPVVAGECHDAQSEMRRMQEFQRQTQDRRTKRELEARIAELEAENAKLRETLDELMALLLRD